ncbi:MAG: Holliday junction branch migration protein RuvA [Microscillaceae bacterium]|jgi:Holliday junction DNA helicase RuvA|nr:Holliday junction branch migration protein RuvA [Microscillaceae bacterium]
MIAYIEGKLVHKEPAYVILDVGGLGYQIRISLHTYSQLPSGEKCKLHTYLQIREDAHTLYGFLETREKNLFLDLISISGIGANTAMMMLSSLTTTEIKQAIVSENVKVIQNIKGIGAKTAQRVILELKDKLKKETSETEYALASSTNTATAGGGLAKSEALLALTTLGIPKAVAEKNLETIIKKYGADLSVEDLIKYALKA